MRKSGVESIKIDGIELTLGNEPEAAPKAKAIRTEAKEPSVFDPGAILVPASVQDYVDTETLTDEQLLYYSVGEQQ